MTKSIYWYDYETFGIDSKYDRLAQFGGIRTDEDLNIISEPLVLFCKPANDMLPDPNACLITNITPQKALSEGLIEKEFIETIHTEFSRPGTCIAGFNNIRFDDEFTRNCLYRNFFNAYEHEWQNGNSRWDIIDLVRMTRALRPEGINWPVDKDGKPSIRLELLTENNGISHESAHDAMSDVYATIEIARLIRSRQPRLYDYMYALRKKQEVSKLLNLRSRDAILHVSSKYTSERYSIAMVMPVCQHPVNKNSIIAYDLSSDPSDYININEKDLPSRIYTKSSDLPENTPRIPLKEIHINKCPALAPVNTMDEACAQRAGINVSTCLNNRNLILENIDSIVTKTTSVYSDQNFPEILDPDAQLYSGGFFSNDDYIRMKQIRTATQEELGSLQFSFDDKRLPEMLFRYRARNFPDSLSPEEIQKWNEYRHLIFTGSDPSHRSLNQYYSEIDKLKLEPSLTEQQKCVLEELVNYGRQIEI